MQFWSDASGAVKGAIIFGVVAGLYLAVAAAAGFAPFGAGPGDEVTQTRGIQAQ